MIWPVRPSRMTVVREPFSAKGRITAAVAQQPALIPYQRQRQEHEQDNHNGHQLIGGDTEKCGELVDIGGEDVDAARIAKHQRHAEHLKADQQVERGGEDERGQHHGHGDIPAHTPDGRAGDAGRLFKIGRQVAHCRRHVKIDMRDMRQPRDKHDAAQGIDVPRHETDDVARKDGNEAGRPDRDRIPESEHQRRNEHRNQHDDFQRLAEMHIGAGEQERECRAQRDGDRHHAHGHDDRVPQGVVEHRVDENIFVCAQAEAGARAEERTIEKALVDDQADGREDAQRQEPDDEPAEEQRRPAGGRPQPRFAG